jgi:hypothetical protein
VGNYDPRPALEKPFVSHFDTGGFSSLVVSQIPSLKFSPFPLALGIYMIGKVSPDAERTCRYVSIQGATLTTQTSTEWVLQAQLVDMGGFSSLLVRQIPSLKFSSFSFVFMIPNPNGKVDF